MTVFLVDRIATAPHRSAALLALLKSKGVPAMQKVGLKLESCRATSDELGEDVVVEIAWSFKDYAQWNKTRTALFLDPAWHVYCAELAALRTGGGRRFFHPTDVEG